MFSFSTSTSTPGMLMEICISKQAYSTKPKNNEQKQLKLRTIRVSLSYRTEDIPRLTRPLSGGRTSPKDFLRLSAVSVRVGNPEESCGYSASASLRTIRATASPVVSPRHETTGISTTNYYHK